MKHYIGHDGFVWWIGIVESTDDPLELGRCKVRCFGYHPSRKDKLVPVEDLPWAMTLMPPNLNNFYGRPNIGDWVIGFFLDAEDAQEPVIMGILPAIPTVARDYFSMHPRFAKTFTKIKNDETPNRNQLINTLHSLVDKTSKQLVTLPAEGVYLSNAELIAVQTLLSTSENTSDQTFAYYHTNGSVLEIGESSNAQKQKINKAVLKLSNNSQLEIRKETLNEKGDITDYVLIDHPMSSGKIELKTSVSSGLTTDNLTISSASAKIEIQKTQLGTTINIAHPSGTSIVISAEGQITINSTEAINVSSAKEVNVDAASINLTTPVTNNSDLLITNTLNAQTINLGGIGNLAEKIAQMDVEIEAAKSLPLPP